VELSPRAWARAYLTEWLGLSRSEAEHVIEVYFENKQKSGYIASTVVRAELNLIGAHDTVSNLSKYLRGFETAHLISRIKTGRGNEIAYRLTENGTKLIEVLEALEKEKIDA
jgi:predicted transcriptional regulator